MDSPLVKKQKDLRLALKEVYLADYFERLCQEEGDTWHAQCRMLEGEPKAKAVIAAIETAYILPAGMTHDKLVVAGLEFPNSPVVLITHEAIMALVREAKSIYVQAQDLLDWMKEKKLDQ